MAATTLSLAELIEVIAEKKVDFAVQGHRGGEIAEESAQARHNLLLDHQYYTKGTEIARGKTAVSKK